MLKAIITIFLISIGIGYFFAYNDKYVPISKQIDVRTMSLKKPDFIVFKHSSCSGDCSNYASSSSYGGGSYGGK